MSTKRNDKRTPNISGNTPTVRKIGRAFYKYGELGKQHWLALL
jgi:hypothetical protein